MTRREPPLLLAAALALAPALALAADQITSSDIREADGTSAQNTNAGAGIKTGHLQDGAVTAQKLAPAAVTPAQLAEGAVVAGKLAPGAVGTAELADGAVTLTKLAPGAIPAAQLPDGAVTTSKLADGAVTGTKLATARTVAVAADGSGQFTDLAAAVDELLRRGAVPYGQAVIRLGPGEYPLAATLRIPRGLSIQGCGLDCSKIRGAAGQTTALFLEPWTALSDLSVEGALEASGDWGTGQGYIRLSRIYVRGAGTFGFSAGVSYAVLDRVHIEADTVGLHVTGPVLDVHESSIYGGSIGIHMAYPTSSNDPKQIVDSVVQSAGLAAPDGGPPAAVRSDKAQLRISRSILRMMANHQSVAYPVYVLYVGGVAETYLESSELYSWAYGEAYGAWATDNAFLRVFNTRVDYLGGGITRAVGGAPGTYVKCHNVTWPYGPTAPEQLFTCP